MALQLSEKSYSHFGGAPDYRHCVILLIMFKQLHSLAPARHSHWKQCLAALFSFSDASGHQLMCMVAMHDSCIWKTRAADIACLVMWEMCSSHASGAVMQSSPCAAVASFILPSLSTTMSATQPAVTLASFDDGPCTKLTLIWTLAVQTVT